MFDIPRKTSFLYFHAHLSSYQSFLFVCTMYRDTYHLSPSLLVFYSLSSFFQSFYLSFCLSLVQFIVPTLSLQRSSPCFYFTFHVSIYSFYLYHLVYILSLISFCSDIISESSPSSRLIHFVVFQYNQILRTTTPKTTIYVPQLP